MIIKLFNNIIILNKIKIKMETDNEFKDISDLLSGIKSKDGENNLLDLLSKMYDTKLDLNNNGLYIE